MVRLRPILSLAEAVRLALVGLAGFVLMLMAIHRLQVDRRPVSPAPIAVAVKTSPVPSTPEEMYLDLLKKTLTRAQTTGRYDRHSLIAAGQATRYLYRALGRALGAARLELVERAPADPRYYTGGGGSDLQGRMEDAETMVGTEQLDHIQFCITDVLKRKVPGDLIECGAWRGGVTILMRAALQVYGDTERSVWVADSFEGLPSPDYRLNPNLGWEQGEMSASLEEVKENFARYGLLDGKVRFLKGYFNKTLPRAPIGKLAVLRADADLYESQKDVLENLYPKLSPGGYAIIDDYLLPGCRRAVDEYRQAHNITEELKSIDGYGYYWQKMR